MYGIYSNIGGILMVNVTIYTIHGSYGKMPFHTFHIRVVHTLPAADGVYRDLLS